MKELYIWHHLGMGDHILCNGIVRYYATLYDKIYLFSKRKNLENVKRLYQDLDNIEFIPGTDDDAKNYMRNKSINLLKVTNFKNHHFDQDFYTMAKVPFSYKWKYAYIERNIRKEKEVFYNILNLKDGENYKFLHQGAEDSLREKNYPKGKIINPGDYEDVGLFDFFYTIENASEVHVINSSFLCMIDTFEISNPNLYYHIYVRPQTSLTLSDNLNWKIIY